MKLYYSLLSPNGRRAMLAALHLGLDMEFEEVDFSSGFLQSETYLRLNPSGLLPTLVDGDFALTESRAILQYLARQKPEAGLWPADARAQADIARWQFWDAEHLSPALNLIAFERVLKKMLGKGPPDEARVDEAMGRAMRLTDLLDRHLASRTFIVGDAVTLADLTIGPSLMSADISGVDLQSKKHLMGWWQRLQSLEAWKKTTLSPEEIAQLF